MLIIDNFKPVMVFSKFQHRFHEIVAILTILITANGMYHLCHLFYHRMPKNVPINDNPIYHSIPLIAA